MLMALKAPTIRILQKNRCICPCQRKQKSPTISQPEYSKKMHEGQEKQPIWLCKSDYTVFYHSSCWFKSFFIKIFLRIIYISSACRNAWLRLADCIDNKVFVPYSAISCFIYHKARQFIYLIEF